MAKKVVLIVLGVLGILVGLGSLAAGVTATALTSGDGWIESGDERIDTATYALVSSPARLEDEAPDFVADLSDISIRIRAATTDPDGEIFLGVAAAADLREYLGGVSYDEIESLDFVPFSLDKLRRDGRREPDPPGEQDIWVTSTEGAGPRTLEWELERGTWQIVVMNADGARGVDVTGDLAVKASFLRPLGIAGILFGVVSVLGGIALLVWGIRTKGTPPAGPPPAAWATPGPPGAPSAGWEPPTPSGAPPIGAGRGASGAPSDAWAGPPR